VNIEFGLLEELADELQGEARGAYSGRAMYGQSCVGIVLDSERELIALGVAISQIVEDEDLKTILTNGARIDTMGMGIIVYWSSLSCEDAPDEDE
jgi:hypothetical protein